MAEPDFPAERYDGPAVVSAAEPEVSGLAGVRTSPPGANDTEDGTSVEVTLRGHFEPLDGRFHWYGRVTAGDELASRHPSGSTVLLTTPHGQAVGRLSDVDPWGRLRISGTGRPPY